jgi:NADPH:quinone reductase-like Zn-dependent oxidoreductase
MRESNVPAPSPTGRQLVIDVHHASLNRGDLNDVASGRIAPGAVLGSDIAGVVSRAATESGGPGVGARVVALAEGGLARRVAVDQDSVALLPDQVGLASAAGLPVAGVAALRSVRSFGSSLGKRVLVTGASGGVGSFAVQLAAASGAYVVALVGSMARGAGLRALGADHVVASLREVAPVDLVIDTVGGSVMTDAWGLVRPGGSLESVGWASREPAVLAPYSTVGPGKTLRSYLTVPPVGEDLRVLVGLMTAGKLRVQIGWQGDWRRFEEAVAALQQRSVQGKAILDLHSQAT